MVVAEKYLELCCIWRAKVGKLEEVEEEEVIGMKASRGPREGVVAVRDPDGLAVRNVPLQPQFSDFPQQMALGDGLTCSSASLPHPHFLITLTSPKHGSHPSAQLLKGPQIHSGHWHLRGLGEYRQAQRILSVSLHPTEYSLVKDVSRKRIDLQQGR